MRMRDTLDPRKSNDGNEMGALVTTMVMGALVSTMEMGALVTTMVMGAMVTAIVIKGHILMMEMAMTHTGNGNGNVFSVSPTSSWQKYY